MNHKTLQASRGSSKQKDFRRSIDCYNHERFRNMNGYDCNPRFLHCQSILTDRFRTSLDFRDLIQRIESKKSQANFYSRLKNTLNELEDKLSKAKTQLRKRKNILDDLDNDWKEDKEPSADKLDCRVNFKQEKGVIGITSLNNFWNNRYTQSAETLLSVSPTLSKIKTYYLQELAKAMSRQSKQAYEHLCISLKAIRSISTFQSQSQIELQNRKVHLARTKNDKRKTLVIDIDETIVHCEDEPTQPYDLAISIILQKGQYTYAYITIRPYAISFLKKMSKNFEIIVFTASQQSYANAVLDQLDPDKEFIKHRLYRQHCFQIYPNIFTKNLKIINRDPSQIVIVDNAPYSYIFQLQNGIPILPFYKGSDYQLLKLEKYLEKLAKCKDVRLINRQTFKFYEYANFQTPEDLTKSLYFNKQ